MSVARAKSLQPTVAPGNLHMVQAFINSRDLETGSDEFADTASLSAWLSRHGLLPRQTELGEDDRQRAVEIRDGLCAVLRGHSRDPIDARAVERLNQAFGHGRASMLFDSDGTVYLEPAEPGFPAVLGRLQAVIFEAVQQGAWERFKVCRNPRCHWAFYDASTNRSGRWCSSKGCGNRANASAYRRRRRR